MGVNNVLVFLNPLIKYLDTCMDYIVMSVLSGISTLLLVNSKQIRLLKTQYNFKTNNYIIHKYVIHCLGLLDYHKHGCKKIREFSKQSPSLVVHVGSKVFN